MTHTTKRNNISNKFQLFYTFRYGMAYFCVFLKRKEKETFKPNQIMIVNDGEWWRKCMFLSQIITLLNMIHNTQIHSTRKYIQNLTIWLCKWYQKPTLKNIELIRLGFDIIVNKKNYDEHLPAHFFPVFSKRWGEWKCCVWNGSGVKRKKKHKGDPYE